MLLELGPFLDPLFEQRDLTRGQRFSRPGGGHSHFGVGMLDAADKLTRLGAARINGRLPLALRQGILLQVEPEEGGARDYRERRPKEVAEIEEK